MKKIIIYALAFFASSLLQAQELQSQWKGAKVAFLGDSITDIRQLPDNDVFWHQLVPILGIEPYVYGISGHKMIHITGQAEKLEEEHGKDVDAIVVFVGTNDFCASVPIGEWFAYDTLMTNKDGVQVALKHRTVNFDKGTFCGRISTVVVYLKEHFPDQQIIFLTPIHRGPAQFSSDNVQPDESYANKEGFFIDDYVRTLNEAADIWGVPVIDLNAICGINPMVESNHKYFRSPRRAEDGRIDLLHPNTPGHLRMAYALAFQLLAYPSGREWK